MDLGLVHAVSIGKLKPDEAAKIEAEQKAAAAKAAEAAKNASAKK